MLQWPEEDRLHVEESGRTGRQAGDAAGEEALHWTLFIASTRLCPYHPHCHWEIFLCLAGCKLSVSIFCAKQAQREERKERKKEAGCAIFTYGYLLPGLSLAQSQT